MHPYFRVTALSPAHCCEYTATHSQAHCTDTQTAPAINNVFAHDHYVRVHKGKTQTHTNTHWQKHPYAYTPAARPPPPQPLVLMDGSLITTLTLGLLSPHLPPRTCVRVSVCVHVWVCLGVVGSLLSAQRSHTLLISRLSLFPSFRSLLDTETHSASYKTLLNTARCSAPHQGSGSLALHMQFIWR